MPRPTVNLTARPTGIAALAVIVAIAGAIGAYAHWILWHPMDGVLISLAAGVALVDSLAPRRAFRTVPAAARQPRVTSPSSS